MSLFTQHNSDNSTKIYTYIIAGGIGSLIILFLVLKSFSLNQAKTQKYHQAIKSAQQQVIKLQKEALLTTVSKLEAHQNLEVEFKETTKILNELNKVPSFISLPQQNIFTSKLETQKILFDSQIQLIRDLQDIQQDLVESCQNLTKIKPELDSVNQTQNNLVESNSNLLILSSSLLNNLVWQCYNPNNQLELTINSQIKQIELFLKQENFDKDHFLASQLISYGQSILTSENKIDQVVNQLELSSLNEKLIELELFYLEYLDQLRTQISRYRLFSYLFFLSIIILIAYKIINNLAKTNRNIVKILEGFTQELESKVEQRTAQLEESIQNTEAALAQAQNANKAKSRFLANMSHELRTPLNAILGFTQLMCRDSSIGKEHQENIQIINRSGEHLLKLINDILEMSKIEVGQISLNENKFDFYTMVKSIEEMLRMKAKNKNINLTFKIGKNIPKYVFTDEGKLRQILINLLGNALKFTEQGEITLIVERQNSNLVSADHIDFLFSDTYALNFAIQDTGAGIADEEMDRLFSPFEQTQAGRISREGTGLGLSICQKFVELMGGDLKVESEVGKGSTFSFTILIKSQESNLNASVEIIENEETRRIIGLAPNQRQYRILAVDDVPASRLLLKKMLTGIGLIVEEAADGQEAVQKWSQWHPDLILMDMRMPVMDGYEATRQIKSQSQEQETMIIALTASAFEEERIEILSAGCDDFMRKPFYETELLETIGKYLNIEYLYEETVVVNRQDLLPVEQLTAESLTVMSQTWRSQLYQAATRVDNQEILQLLAEIPEEYESLAKSLESLVDHFRCDKIIDLTK